NEAPLPLCDTEVTLSGDQFAKHFGVEKSITSDTYQAIAVELHVDTTFIMDNAENMTAGEGEYLSAPATVTFRAYANDPVVALYSWKIYRSDVENGAANPLLEDRSDETDFTFTEKGEYTAVATVSNATGECEAVSNSIEIKIAESDLQIPNAFSPGTTPGINDEFRVAYKSLVTFKCWIFNRWGVQMYHSTNPAEGWDGKKGGKYVAPGVYFYVIEAVGSDGIKYNKKGSINILRPKKIDDEIIEQ
ncbi:gliding motility-associated C-terminal domain-containing protein, partial [uncultured Parabacteroides sp.]